MYDYLLIQPWCKDYTKADLIEQSKNSFNYFLIEQNKAVCYLRLLTDWNSFGYITDVVTLPNYQGLGLGTLFLDEFFSLEEVKAIKEIFLIATDNRIYEKFNFKPFRYQHLFHSNSKKN